MQICHEYPINQENSVEGFETGRQPTASEKHPISNTYPWGLAKICLKASWIMVCLDGKVMGWLQKAQTMISSSFENVFVSATDK
jgi:hypothetical protein